MTVFEIGAKLGLDSKAFVNGLNSASSSVSSFASKTKQVLGGAAKAATAALGVASAGVAALTKQAVSAYADYEQLVGGVETLFGDAAKTIKENADKAFKTAGLSVNEYFDTSIQSAAALINSLDGDQKKAAEIMDMSITDMADNVNKMGTSMEGVQNAYRGFSRGNFTMLDNLALGFSGTKDGMQQLLDKAKELSGVEYDIASYSDIVQAIHVVQTEMGITGTTAKEAAETISGSIATMKSSWKNLIVEMGKDDGNMEKAFNNLQESIATVGTNVLPRVEQTLSGISQLITESAPQVTTAITKLIPKILPAVIRSASQLVSGVGGALLNALPELLDAGRNLLANLAYSLENSSFDGNNILGNILDTIVSNAPYYLQYAKMILSNLANQLLNVDYKKLGSSFSKLFTDAINSITDLVKDIDFYKVGENIADFLNSIDWQEVANSIFNLLAEGMKALGDIAVSFFANADLGNLMTMIGLLGAPKILNGITSYTSSAEGQSLGQAAGSSWSSAFMAGIKAFGLGYAIGTWLRDNITIGDKTIGEWVDKGTENVFDTIAESDILSKTAIGKTVRAAKEEEAAAKKDEPVMFTTIDGKQAQMYNSDGKTLSQVYLNDIKKRAAESAGVWNEYAQSDYMKEQRAKGLQGLSDYYSSLPKYGDGGRVTSPTLAIIGEKEPETVVPDSKKSEFGSVHVENVTINVQGTFDLNSPEEQNRFIEQVSMALSNLSVKEQRALGGTAWR